MMAFKAFVRRPHQAPADTAADARDYLSYRMPYSYLMLESGCGGWHMLKAVPGTERSGRDSTKLSRLKGQDSR